MSSTSSSLFEDEWSPHAGTLSTYLVSPPNRSAFDEYVLSYCYQSAMMHVGYSAPWGEEAHQDMVYWRATLELWWQTVVLIWQITLDGETVGFIIAKRLREMFCISRMFLLPRAQRRGYGSRALGAVEQYARILRQRALCVYVDRQNPGACVFWQRMGFRERPDANYLPATDDTIYMEKSL